MAADDKDAEETTVYETDVQEGEPLVIRMPVDIRSVTLTVLTVLAGILMLQYAKPVFIPVILGTLISYVLGPAVTSMAKHGIPRVLGAFLVIVALCGTLGYGVYSLTDEVVDILDDVPQAAQKLRDRVKNSRRGGGEEGLLSKVQSAATQIDEAAADATKPAPKQEGRAARPDGPTRLLGLRLRLGRRAEHSQLSRAARHRLVPRLLPARYRRSL